jgi:hypothetical protein
MPTFSCLAVYDSTVLLWIWLWIWLLPLVLTLLAWLAGLHVIATGTGSKARRWARTWPAMLFLAVPLVMMLGNVWQRYVSHHAFPASFMMWYIAAASSVGALVASTWAPRRFRVLALCAAAGWVGWFASCFYLFSRMARP